MISCRGIRWFRFARKCWAVCPRRGARRKLCRAFIEYYEAYARETGCTELRIDTNARNAVARAMYKKHGYTEIGIVPTVFNGIEGVQLVLLEKYLWK